ncbi:piercer of microtubule wall 1 protein [Microcaecilia unicolor]|uniref:UPF0691 protein C9orf116 homolog n=1 Tax=Microcaecilia unicolor TaxID=1415580 RepID=A0A6P7YGM2_9AMPH|nr:UPF0691 protein C9orf116 homolog [Microcaecilia unicolor]
MAQTPSQEPQSNSEPDPQRQKTSDYYRVKDDLPPKFNDPESWYGGYRYVKTNPLFRTTNQTYGSRMPTVHEMPTCFNAVCNKFSTHLRNTGMYRNHGFNTSTEKSYVTGPDNFITFYDRLNFHRSYNRKGPSFSD